MIRGVSSENPGGCVERVQVVVDVRIWRVEIAVQLGQHARCCDQLVSGHVTRTGWASTAWWWFDRALAFLADMPHASIVLPGVGILYASTSYTPTTVASRPPAIANA